MSAPRLTAVQARALAVLAETEVVSLLWQNLRAANHQLAGVSDTMLFILGCRGLARSDWSFRWRITPAGRTALAAHTKDHDHG